MEANKEPAIQIPTLTSKEQKDKMAEIQRRLQSDEAQKARKLLGLAMSNFEAMKLVRNDIEKKVLNGSYAAGFRLFKD